jgi:23S rRNA-/tRNA-specific pseudouridylate synthase
MHRDRRGDGRRQDQRADRPSRQQRQRMAVMEGGKPAVSHYRVLKRFRSHTHVRVKLETGRTHQIRVHMAHINFPLVGDQTYGGRFRIPPAASPTMVEALKTSRARRCTRVPGAGSPDHR